MALKPVLFSIYELSKTQPKLPNKAPVFQCPILIGIAYESGPGNASLNLHAPSHFQVVLAQAETSSKSKASICDFLSFSLNLKGNPSKTTKRQIICLKRRLIHLIADNGSSSNFRSQGISFVDVKLESTKKRKRQRDKQEIQKETKRKTGCVM